MPTRSEPASARKLKRAKESGDAPSSSHLTQALTLGTGLCILPSMFALLWGQTGNQIRTAFRNSTVDSRGLEHAVQLALIDLIELSLPILAVIAVTQFASKIIQNGGFGTSRPSNSIRSRSNFQLGLGRLFTWRGFLTQVCALAISVTLVSHSLVWIRDNAIAVTATLGDIPAGLRLIARMTKQQLWFALAVWACVGCIELTLAYRLWLRRQMMSSDEKRQEQKETEGDPLILWQRARFRSQILSESSNWSVSEGTLVIHDKMRLAAVLHYDPASNSAPRLLGVGASDLAGVIISEAQRFSIPIAEHEPLARILAGSGVGEPIPERLYELVAELISEVR